MKYMIMTFGDVAAWDTLGLGAREATWSEQEVAEHFRTMSAFYSDLAESGEMVTGFGLADPSHTMTLEIRDGRPVASDGPYAEAKEVLAGFGVLDVARHDRAVELAARFAAIVQTRVELRPVMDGAGHEMWREVTGTERTALTRRYGHFDLAEEAVQEALLAAATQWPA